MRFLVPLSVAVALGVGVPTPASGQSDVSVEVGYSQAGAPADLDREPGRFAIGGLRASHYRDSGSGLVASFLAGRSFDTQTGGDFLSGSLSGSLMTRVGGGGWSAGVEARGLAFEVETPFLYRAWGVEGGPQLRFRGSRSYARLTGIAGLGRSRLEARGRTRDRPRVLEEDLWRLGGSAEWLFGSATVMGGIAASAHRSAGGEYFSGGGRIILSAGSAVAEVRADRWETPLGAQTTGGVSIVIPLGGDAWGLRGFFGRSEPDPLTLSEPGSNGAGFLASRSLLRSGSPEAASPLHEVLEETTSGVRVRIRIEAPEGADRVALLGDFTLWDEIPMQRRNDTWTVDVDVPLGTHHFGFVVDSEWYLPANAPDRVPDEWGRESATLIIER